MNLLLRLIARLKQSAEERWPPEFYDFWDDDDDSEDD